MTQQLRSCLLALVVLNLVFVQITGSVTSTWMLPLFALAILSPLLWPLQRWFVYRAGWNVALIAIFGLLLYHTKQSGIRFLLEDGLILAAFCQVHVLNNLNRQQKPDLIFFNSFLIALVTGFFCQHVVYSAVFVVYGLVLIVSLSVSASGTVGWLPRRSLAKAEFGQLLGRSAWQGLMIMLFTGLVFTFWPRDFQREGLVQTDLIHSATAMAEVGFSDQVRLDRKRRAVASTRIVARIKLVSGRRDQIPQHWRGATFTNLQKYGWWADSTPQTNGYVRANQFDQPWERLSEKEFTRKGHKTGAEVEVSIDKPRVSSLFSPLGVHHIKFDCTAWPRPRWELPSLESTRRLH